MRDARSLAQIDDLLLAEGISRDKNLDYICAMYDDNYQVIATGSCFKNTLRCFAVRRDHQGEGLLNEIISHLIQLQYQRGNIHLFLYTKVASAKFFGDLGFYEIARVEDTLVFMENKKNGFTGYLKSLEKTKTDGRSAALVMNANPFTLGHQYLAEKAASEWDTLHLFIVSEDASLVPFAVRRRLVMEGTRHLKNIICHDSGSYMISSATFPSYFLKDEVSVITSHAKLDIAVFTKIAQTLNIRARYIGEEPTSQVTGLYNRIMAESLPQAGIDCIIVPRLCADDTPISASIVRSLIKAGDFDALSKLLPATSLAYFMSPEAQPVIDKIRNAPDVVHY
jgi:[citrate (pro-3S)-lyase] ligase